MANPASFTSAIYGSSTPASLCVELRRVAKAAEQIEADSVTTDHKTSKGAEEMRFILGVLVGYSMRGREKRLITFLAVVAFIVYILLPATALLALSLDVKKERQSRPVQTRVPAIKGLSYEDAEIKLRTSDLNIRVLATRYDLQLQPGLIIDQNPQPGEDIVYGYPVGVTIAESNPHGP